ncbi:hypothetical protein ACG9XS_21735, partial [Acinetobacter gyllenbergii]
QQQCEDKYKAYDKTIKYIEANPGVRTYRTIETGFFGIFKFGTENRAILLVFMVLISAITASLKYHHIGLRNPATKIDYKVYSLFMLLGNALLSFSVISQYRSVINSGVTPTYET